ncbi:hypothetical protein EIP91_000912 [Steccherinum ochraceum]|uniref:Uncharacterized protein n=1 Tax=Steccherinum ochraceum TaxID=92696 RepID=A0A4R0RVP1_9APHY|nr:hypothetical protein EIP91_000912 [Steccherinum ochraceum]
MSLGSYNDGEDYDFDVYLWYPSSRPEVVVPEGVDLGPEIPLIYERQLDDQLDDATSEWPSLSSTYSAASDYDFPCKRDMDKAGYSRFFSSGLVLTSQQVTRRLDGFIRTVGKHLKAIVQRFKA